MSATNLLPPRPSRGFAATVLAFVMSLAAGALPAQPQAPPAATAVGVRVGDRIILKVEGETQLSDTFTVTAGPALILPLVGSISLAEVRRENVEKLLTTEIGKFIRNPVVKARLLVRVAILGEVGKPGFYAVPIDALVSDVIMMAGGITKDSRTKDARIERNGVTTWRPESLRVAVRDSRTLTQLGVQPEDAFVVPKKFDWEKVGRITSMVIMIPVAVLGIMRGFSR